MVKNFLSSLWKQKKSVRFLRHGAIYATANIYEKSLLFIIPMLFSFFIAPEELGKLIICNTLILIVNIFIGQNVTGLLTIDYLTLKKDQYSALFSNTVSLILITTLVATFIISLFSPQIYDLYGIELKHLILIALVCYFSVINQCFGAYLRTTQASGLYFKFSTFRTTLDLLICLAGIYYFSTWEWRLYSAVIANILVVCLEWLILNSFLKLKINVDKDLIKSILKYSLPLIPHAIGGWLIQMIDKTLIPIVLSRESLGIYSLSFQVGMATSIVSISYNQAWAPQLYKMLSDSNPEKDKKIVKTIYGYMFMIFLFALLNSGVGILFINTFLPDVYRGNESIIILTAIGYSLQAWCASMIGFILYEKQNKVLMYMTPSIGILHIGSCYLGLKYFGLVGASISFVCSNLIFFFFAWKFARKVHPMPWSLRIKTV